MTKRNMLLVSLLLVFGLGVLVPAALAQAPTEGNGTIVNVAPSLYTLRPNSTADADGAVFLNFGSGFGTIAGGEIFTITYSKPIVGASSIHSLAQATAAANFCDDDNATGIAGVFCSAMTFTASGNTLTLTNGSTPIAGWTGGYITIWGTRVDTVGLVPGTFVTATVAAALNQSYPISFTSQGATQAAPVNVGLVANTSSGGSVTMSTSPATILTCVSGGTNTVSFSVDVKEQWAGAWTSLSDEFSLAPYAPSTSKTVTNGSEISVTLTGVPEGVTIALDTISNDTGTQTWGTPSATTCTGSTANDTCLFEFPLASTVRQELEGTTFTFDVTTPGAIPGNSPAMQASVQLNPTTPVTGAYPAFTYPIAVPSLAAEPNSPQAAVTFIGCQTSLLFPYVTNLTQGAGGGALGNWDTGLQISNTTSDPFGGAVYWDSGYITGGYDPQDGACTWYVYHAGTSATLPSSSAMATPITFTRPVILSGGTDAFMLSGTAAAGVQAGYAIAICNFLGAVGQAGMADNTGIGDWQVMESYLPYVIPNPYVVGRTWDAITGEFAITPIPYFDDGPFNLGPATRILKQQRPMVRRHK